MPDLADDITAFLRGERRRMAKQGLVAAIVRVASSGLGWPKASHQQWEWAIDTAVKRGQLATDGKLVWVVDRPAEDSAEQLELF